MLNLTIGCLSMNSKPPLPKLAVWKFTSCDGCQLSLLDCEDELLQLVEVVEIANFLEASKKVSPGPYDISVVEGSITTPLDIERIKEVRKLSKKVITIGACATAGGIQALRNYADVDKFIRIVYAHPEYIETLATSTPIAEHIDVDYELHGCPINKEQLIEVLTACIHGRRPHITAHSVCTECKARHTVCVQVAYGIPCLGPVTHAGCNALCPAYKRGCYGCFGPKETAAPLPLTRWWKEELGQDDEMIKNSLRTFNCQAEPFKKTSKQYEE